MFLLNGGVFYQVLLTNKMQIIRRFWVPGLSVWTLHAIINAVSVPPAPQKNQTFITMH